MKAAEQTHQSVSDHVQRSVDQDLSNLRAFRADLDSAKIVDMARQIEHARRVIVLGIDYAASLAASQLTGWSASASTPRLRSGVRASYKIR